MHHLSRAAIAVFAGALTLAAAGPAATAAPRAAGVSDVPGVTSAHFLTPGVTPLVGESGTFTFTPHARGVVKYDWWIDEGSAQEVRASADGTAKVRWTPPGSTTAKYELFVESVTASGALSGLYDDWIVVQDPRPTIQPAAGVHRPGEPVPVTISNGASQATGFVYRFDGGPKQTVTGRTATVQVTPAHAGARSFTAQTLLTGGAVSKPVTATIPVTDAPRISVSAPHGETQPVGTEPATYTFTPSVPNVVSYQYQVDGDSRTVAAAADGTASVTFVSDPGGPHSLTVSSVDADGGVSDVQDYEYTALDPTIWVYAEFDQGAGRQGFFSVVDDLTPVIAAYHWSVDGGPEQVTPAGPADGNFTEVDYTPAHSGTGTLQIQAEYRDGTLSPVTSSPFEVN